MKALLLAGGFGTRLRPLTYTRPKHLLPIANRTHIEHVFDLLLRYDIREVVLTTSYLAEAFDGVVETARAAGLDVRVTHEEVALGTAGAMKHAQGEIGSATFLALNADVLTDVDLGTLVEFHRSNEAEATIFLAPVEDPSAFGVVPTDEVGRVLDFVEKPAPGEAPTNLINAGVYVLEPSVLDRVPPGEEWSVERAVFPQLVDDGARVFATAPSAYWMDIGTPEKYLQANLDALQGLFFHQGAAVAHDVEMASSATVTSSCVGPGARIEAGASVVQSVLLPGVVISEGAAVERCVLGEGVVVASGVHAVARTVGDDEKVESGA